MQKQLSCVKTMNKNELRKQLFAKINKREKETGIPKQIKGNASYVAMKEEYQRIQLKNQALSKIQNKWRQYKVYSQQPPILKQVRQTTLFKGDVKKTAYQWINSGKITPKTFKAGLNQLAPNDRVMLTVKTQDDELTVRTMSVLKLQKQIKDGFQLYSYDIGSDPDINETYTIDFSYPLIVLSTIQKSQLAGKCNNQKTSVVKLKNCIVVDPYTKSRNCGFACLKHLGYKTDVKLSDQGPLTPEQMKIVCERNNIPVEIVLDELDENMQLKSICKAPSSSVHRKVVFATKKGKFHYYVYVEMRENEEQKLVKMDENKLNDKDAKLKEWILVFYDLETVFDVDSDNLAQTYSCSYFHTTFNQFKTKITQENVQQFKDDCAFIKGPDVCEVMVNNLSSLYDTSKYRFKFISFNGSCFDDYFLLKQAMKYQERVSACAFQTKSILGLQFEMGQCWDLRKFLTIGSLSYLCDSFKIYPVKQKGFSHRLPQKAFEQGRLQQWVGENEKKIEEYNKLDVLALYSLTQKFRDQILDLTATDVFNFSTIGQHSYKLCKKQWTPEMRKLLMAPISEEDDLFIRKCLTAGRCQIFRNGGKPVHLKGERLSMIDVVSLYPYVMMAIDKFYPCGDYKYVYRRNKNLLGFYKIQVTHRKDIPNVLPKRDYDNPQIPLDWDCKDKFETYCTSIDLDVLESHGHEYFLMTGLEFESKLGGDQIFSSLLPFKQEKIKQDIYKEIYQPARERLYNPALRETCKIYLNALSGKVIQQNFDNVTQIIRSRRELHQFIDNVKLNSVKINYFGSHFTIAVGKKKISYDKKLAKPSYLGVYIYSHARQHMYDNIYTQFETEYSDTDSALGTHKQELLLREKRKELFQKTTVKIDDQDFEIKDFGTLDCELEEYANEAILLLKKNYYVGNRDNVHYDKDTQTYGPYFAKVRGKGVSFKGESCKYLPEDYKSETISNYGFHMLTKKLSDDPLYFYDQMLKNGSVKIACEQLVVYSVKNATNNFGVAVRHLIKQIKLKQ